MRLIQKRHERAPLPPYTPRGCNKNSATQPCRHPDLRLPWRLQSCKKYISVVYKPSSLWYFVISAWTNIHHLVLYIAVVDTYTHTHTHTHTHRDLKVYIKCQQHRRRNKALGSAEERQTGCGRGAFAASRREQDSLKQIRGKCFLGREHRVQSSRVWPVWPIEGQLVIAMGLKQPGGWKDTDGWSPRK